MNSESLSRGRGRGRFITKNSFTLQQEPIPPSLSQYILPDENFEDKGFIDFKEYDLSRIVAEENSDYFNAKVNHDANNNTILKNAAYEQIASAISLAAEQAASVYNPRLEKVPVAHKTFKNQKVKKSWNVFQTNESDDDSCAICDRPDLTVFCKTCGHSWKVNFYFLFEQNIS